MDQNGKGYRDYGYCSQDGTHMLPLLLPSLLRHAGPLGPGRSVLDVGCGNGSTVAAFLGMGCKVVGIDLSETGVTLARTAYPNGRFEVLDASGNLLEKLQENPFDVIISTEVVEHLYDPRSFAEACYSALKPGGKFICTTPYHGYMKNLVIAILGKWDTHADPLWDGGHIKFWSRRTLGKLLREAGFIEISFQGIGRVPWLWMSMIMVAERPNY